MSATIRHITMMQLIPLTERKPSRKLVTATYLQRELADVGFKVTKRTIERDLHSLSRHFGLHHEEDEQGTYWWTRTRSLEEVPI